MPSTPLNRGIAGKAYNVVRELYLAAPIGFGIKRAVKDVCFGAVSLVNPEAGFLKAWQAKQKFERRRRLIAQNGDAIYGGEDELFLYGLQQRWTDLLALPPEEVAGWLLPALQRRLRASHLNKTLVPQVSVIIPAHGHAIYTLLCLDSLFRQQTDVAFDIHLADDLPSDPVLAGYAARLQAANIHYHRNSLNLGFTRNVNAAAHRASADLIVILNNDTFCHPLWLDHLVATYRRLGSSSSVGAIGSKVLHRHLRVQESGCLMKAGGHPSPLGRGAHAFDPRFSFLREVDFVSACSLLVPRQLFLELGGFDERFSPGYYEDPDLCERLRQRGYRTYVQPASLLLHEEGASFGKQAFAAVQEEKRALFNQLHPAPISTEDRFEAKPQLLFIDAYLPMPDKGSGSIDAMAYLEYFIGRGYHVIFYAQHHNNYFENYSKSLEAIGVEVLQDNFQSLPSLLAERSDAIRLVFVSRYYQLDHFLPLIERALPDAALIYNTVDLHFLRESREAGLVDPHAAGRQPPKASPGDSSVRLAQLRQRELAYIQRADASIVISAYERDLLAEILPGVNSVFHVPQCRPFIGAAQGFDQRRDFLFIGSAHQPNVDALRYFQAAIHPLLRRSLPEYRLNVIGQELYESFSRVEDAELLSNSHVSFLGYVEDVMPLFATSLAMLVPLRYGSGIKGKVVQAIQHGLPCVTTAIGAEGLELPDQSSVLIADGPEQMVDQLVALSTDPQLWQVTSDRAEAVFQARFSQAVFEQRLDRLMEQTITPRLLHHPRALG